MNTPEVVAAIAAPTTLALAGLIVTAAAREWLHISVAVTVKPIPAVKRQPKNAVAVQVIPATVEPVPDVPKIGAARGVNAS